MRVLVIGKSGQLARSLLNCAWPGGWEVVACGRPQLDLTRPETVHRAITDIMPDHIVNTAAYTAVDAAESDPETAFAINRDGAALLAEICAERGIPLVHISTDYVFDGTADEPYAETDTTSPIGVYGASKLAGEERVRNLLRQHLILRTAWVHSPHGRNFVRTMLELARDRDEIAVVHDQRGNPTYAPHLAEAIVALLQAVRTQKDLFPWGTYHVAGSGSASWHDLAREVFVHSERHGGPVARVVPIATADYPTPARRPANSRLDCTKLAATFGIRLPHWREGVARCVQRLLTTMGDTR